MPFLPCKIPVAPTFCDMKIDDAHTDFLLRLVSTEWLVSTIIQFYLKYFTLTNTQTLIVCSKRIIAESAGHLVYSLSFSQQRYGSSYLSLYSISVTLFLRFTIRVWIGMFVLHCFGYVLRICITISVFTLSWAYELHTDLYVFTLVWEYD